MFGIGHLNMEPLIYGILMFFGLWHMWSNLTSYTATGFKAFLVEAGVFALVFSLHGGSMSGGFAAMICALFFGLVYKWSR